MSLTYTPEYDWITYDQLYMLVSMKNSSISNPVLDVLVSAGIDAAAAKLIAILGLPAAVSGAIFALTLYINLIYAAASLDTALDNIVAKIDHDDEYMFVKYGYYSNYLIKDRMIVSRQYPIPNPEPDIYGFWYGDEYCVRFNSP